MKLRSVAISAVAAIVIAFSAFAADDKPQPVGPPQPRVVQSLPLEALPPRAADPSWLTYQEGLRLFGQKRFGEALVSFRNAIDTRASLFDGASRDIAAALATKEAARAGDSLSSLVELLAARDLIPQDFDAVDSESSGSIMTEMRMLRERSPSDPLRGLIDATLLVVEERGLSRVGDSIAALRKATADLMHYPEAEFGIGRIYLVEGESGLAELQIRRACDMGESLEVGEDRYAMLETLAGIYSAQGDLKDCEHTLREIADASELFAVKDEYYRNAMERTLATQGVDKFMALYRVQEGFSTSAYSRLGSLYLEAGRPLAVIYLAAAVNAVLAREIGEIKVDEPDYAYKDLSDLVARIGRDESMSRFAEESGLWRDMVLLGEALAQGGYRDTARELWSAVLLRFGPAETWGKRAARDINSSRNASKGP
jgi:tetratricopeptide (TPR) repeat protein